MKSRIYADHAATTPVREEVLQAMLPHFESGYNPSSLHTEGRAARAALDAAREEIAGCLGARAKEIVFTGGGSESDNLAIFGTARLRARDGRHLITSAIEHHAVMHAFETLASEGFNVDVIPVNDCGVVSINEFRAALRTDTIVASVMVANNEIGTLQPVRELAALARARGITFHTDAVQAVAHLPLDVRELGVDLLSISAHKFYGPKGVGALYVREGTPLRAQIVGGAQEFALRAGTENVAGIVGMARALELAVAQRTSLSARLAALRNRFEAGVLAAVPDVRVNGGGADRLPHISNLSFSGVAPDAFLLRLDLEGVAASTGSACAAGAVEPSHVIAALGAPEPWAANAVRFSFGASTSAGDIDRLIAIVTNVALELRKFSAAIVL